MRQSTYSVSRNGYLIDNVNMTVFSPSKKSFVRASIEPEELKTASFIDDTEALQLMRNPGTLTEPAPEEI